jgi:hypothetical protein
MRYHKSATTTDLLRRGPAKIAMMIASEFWRAHAGADYKEDVKRCYWRARELMGVLEIADLPESIGLELQPYYRECAIKSMFNENQFLPSAIKVFSIRFAEMFDQIAQKLAAV